MRPVHESVMLSLGHIYRYYTYTVLHIHTHIYIYTYIHIHTVHVLPVHTVYTSYGRGLQDLREGKIAFKSYGAALTLNPTWLTSEQASIHTDMFLHPSHWEKTMLADLWQTLAGSMTSEFCLLRVPKAPPGRLVASHRQKKGASCCSSDHPTRGHSFCPK